MKKKFHTFLVNISILFILIMAIEGIIWHQENQTLRQLGNIKSTDKNIPFHAGVQKFNLDLDKFPQKYVNYEFGHQPYGLEYTKKPLVLFGCSYAYGYNLKDEETLAYKLSHQAKVPVYNRAFSGWGIQHMLYQVKNDLFYKKVPEPSYAIYLYIPDHINRLYFYSFGSYDTLTERQNLRYIEKNRNLIKVNNNNFVINQFKRLYLVNKINQFLTYKKTSNVKTNKKCYDFALKHFVTARDEMKKYWKNTEYVIIFHTATSRDDYLKEQLLNNNFIVIDTNELTNQNMLDNTYMKEDFHPTEEAWKIIVPQLIKELGI